MGVPRPLGGNVSQGLIGTPLSISLPSEAPLPPGKTRSYLGECRGAGLFSKLPQGSSRTAPPRKGEAQGGGMSKHLHKGLF